MKDKRKVFVDSNVWFAYLWGSETIEELIEGLLGWDIEVVVCEQVVLEVFENVKRKIPGQMKNMERFWRNYEMTIVKDVVGEEDLVSMVDSKDRVILAAAVEYGCEYLVTGNIKDFRVKEIEKECELRVIKPREMLEELSRR